MSQELDPSNAPRSPRSRTAIAAGALAFLVLAVLAGFWLAPLVGRRKPAESASATPATTPAPVTAPAPAASEPPPITIEASREAKPRPKKKVEAPPPTVAAPAAPTTAELHIDSDVPGAMVFIDRRFVGNTPVTATDIPPGRHQINLTADGYDGQSESIEVAAGPTAVMVKFKEIRLSETVDVVHKHGIGSCEGRLLADPAGVRFETTNKNDAFTLRFSDLETFEVDYLNKNLKIKKRGGKQYNFTTRAGNADPLFVFHRNVDKVRQQVLAGGIK